MSAPLVGGLVWFGWSVDQPIAAARSRSALRIRSVTLAFDSSGAFPFFAAVTPAMNSSIHSGVVRRHPRTYWVLSFTLHNPRDAYRCSVDT